MTNTIEATLTAALPAGAQQMYPSEYSAVLNALNERENHLVELIAEEVNSLFSVPQQDVLDRLAEAGMAVRPAPEPEPEAEAEAPAKDKKGKKSKRLDAIEAKVNRLFELAERHLGASL